MTLRNINISSISLTSYQFLRVFLWWLILKLKSSKSTHARLSHFLYYEKFSKYMLAQKGGSVQQLKCMGRALLRSLLWQKRSGFSRIFPSSILLTLFRKVLFVLKTTFPSPNFIFKFYHYHKKINFKSLMVKKIGSTNKCILYCTPKY